jgi:hypothetical protein
MRQLSSSCENIRLINNEAIFKKFKIPTLFFPTDLDNDLDVSNIPLKKCVIFYGTHKPSGIGDLDKNIWHQVKNLELSIKYLFKLIKKRPYSKYKYTIILSKTDKILKKSIHIPNNIDYIYANNINYVHPKIKHFPMGRDFNKNSIYCYNKFKSNDKTILCWCNFSLRKVSDENNTRHKIYNMLKNKTWITFNVQKTFPEDSFKNNNNFQEWEFNYYKNLNKTKFMICPLGNGLETYRFYDSIYSGAIPIVVKEGILYDKFKDFPILFLNSIDDFSTLTEEYLIQQYEIISKKFRSYQRLLDMNYWLENINKHVNFEYWNKSKPIKREKFIFIILLIILHFISEEKAKRVIKIIEIEENRINFELFIMLHKIIILKLFSLRSLFFFIDKKSFVPVVDKVLERRRKKRYNKKLNLFKKNK